MTRKSAVILIVWLILFGLALLVDGPVARHVRQQGWDQKRSWSPTERLAIEIIKLPGEFAFTAGLAIVVWLTHRSRWRAAVLLVLTAGISAVNSLLKWLVGRRRPVVEIEPFHLTFAIGGLQGLLGSEKNLCFPSGHAALSFATAAALSHLWPRWQFGFYAIASVVGLERIFENAHYVSDVVAGAGLGLMSVIIALRLGRRFGWWSADAFVAGSPLDAAVEIAPQRN